jgi:thiol peroxidase
MTQARAGAFMFAGKAVTLHGPELKPGDKAPNFEVTANDLSKVTLNDSKGKVRLISVVPSLDTGVCDAQTRKFNESAATLGNHVVILTVSADLPFAQKRWCGAAGIEGVQTLSDHLSMSFAEAYGTYNKDYRLESRAVFVVDSSDTVVYAQYLPAAGEHPNYEAALEAAKAAK